MPLEKAASRALPPPAGGMDKYAGIAQICRRNCPSDPLLGVGWRSKATGGGAARLVPTRNPPDRLTHLVRHCLNRHLIIDSSRTTDISGEIHEKGEADMLFAVKGRKAHGQGLVEYALILVLVVLVVIPALMILGLILGNTFSTINDSLNSV